MNSKIISLVLLSVCLTAQLIAQAAPQRFTNALASLPTVTQDPNTDPIYKALRNIGTGEVLSVDNITLKRDAGTFTLNGTLCFLAPVNGKVTGAVFFGHGTFDLVPPIEVEKKTLSLLTKESTLHEEFERAVFRFTDGTFEEVKKAAGPQPASISSGGDIMEALGNVQKYQRKTAKYNLDGRISEDTLGTQQGGLFWAFINGKKISGKMLFAIDPHGLISFGVQPEEVALATYEDNKTGQWTSFHFSNEY